MPEAAKKILIVEDEKPMARALELKLTHHGFLVQTAGDGQEALTILAEKKFDLILLDLIMPKIDGFTVLKNIREQKNLTPVIVLSNLSQEEDTKRAKELGAKGFFIKSNTPIADIIGYVKEALM